jgi:uncharacterized protein (DUF1015 family)
VVLIRPFQALHPNSSNAKEIACFPYDVAYEDEVREFVLENPNSFLRVTRPEADFGQNESVGSEAVLDAARSNLEDLIANAKLVRDPDPSIYVYRLESEEHSQTGIVACCSLADYERGAIKKHEKIQPEKVAERTAHMVELRAQTGLILLAFKATEKTRELIAETVEGQPIFEFTCAGGFRHSVWRMANSRDVPKAFEDIDNLYIADGHHRIESALNVRNILRSENGSQIGNAPYDLVMAGMFPSDELRILPYNRIVRNLSGLSNTEFLEKLNEDFLIAETEVSQPIEHGVIDMYLGGRWYELRFKTGTPDELDPIERLDVTILQKHLLEPVLGIGDPGNDGRLGFVGGARGTEELERLVDSGEAAVAFALYPTAMEDLFAVSDMGEIMPPKSTWFEPKLKDGLFVHLI